MREINSLEELAACCRGDSLCRWAAQRLGEGNRAWASADGRALAVAGRALSMRDRLAVWGDPRSAVPLARTVLDELGPAYRPLGDRTLIDALAAELPGLTCSPAFGWMDRTRPGPSLPSAGAAQWLPRNTLDEASAVVAAGFPDSYAQPGGAGAGRWAGVRDGAGRLVAVGALAWSAPTVGLLSGIAVLPEARGRGLARQVCALLLDEALTRHGTAALMVDDDNPAALHLYRSLGLRYRPLRAAGLRGPETSCDSVRSPSRGRGTVRPLGAVLRGGRRLRGKG
ncbi:GNAT family N-acetyltransferase [Streptomyces sp. ET3-23]|uniref:GNAT family N-acetyltransferase n=1 Tax=Streptomyces sp. ET3-23 TaxID=2885643 RepID=UPI001D120F63|nr:GNAT family N-acetyltransferase [Streptomyces sp. ET3-23]MCC2274042.1 GNAT family N-acetyltransferase [Streptomyces sp. ET3-23]